MPRAVRAAVAGEGNENFGLNAPVTVDVSPLGEVCPSDTHGPIRVGPRADPVAFFGRDLPRIEDADRARCANPLRIGATCEGSLHRFRVGIGASRL